MHEAEEIAPSSERLTRNQERPGSTGGLARNGLAFQAQQVYFFCDNAAEGDPERKDILGGKGSSLAAMCGVGLPVPPGFTISIACCRYYHENGGKWPEGLEEQVRAYMARLEQSTGRRFGEGREPLLVSVRSGAAQSMPGMMDTILNCGLHPGLAEAVPAACRFWSVYAAFARQFGSTVADIPASAFEETAARITPRPDATLRSSPLRSTSRDKALTEAYIGLYERESGRPFPRTPWDALRECMNAVFDSWNNERAKIYRDSHGMTGLEGTAVNVQSMFNSHVSGIGFTVNPARPDADEIVIESSYGLGESVVSGTVTPDRFVVDSRTLEVKETAIGHKGHVMSGLAESEEAGQADPDATSLTDDEVREVASLALRVQEHFGFPVDIEWGLADGKFSLLQSRAVRGLDVARDVEAGRLEEIRRLRELTGDGEKVWIVHNLAETLAAPTPLTWDITRDYMTGGGGYGLMYQDFGYMPSRRVREEGSLDLICGRIYTDPDRAAEQFWEGLPVRYDHEEVLKRPSVLESAPTKFDAERADGRFLVRLPKTLFGMLRAARRTKRARTRAAEEFETKVVPWFTEYVAEKRKEDLSGLSTSALVKEVRDRLRRVMDDFGRESLKPGFFGGQARAELEQTLVQLMGPLEGERYCQVLTSGLEGNTVVEQNIMQYRVACGEESLSAFLERYGHRAVGEMEFAKPRYREAPGLLEKITGTRKARNGLAQQASPPASPEALHRKNAEKRTEAMRELPEVLKKWGGSCFREEIEALAREAQRLLPYREVGKHYLMMGYELIRTAVLELGRRFGLGDSLSGPERPGRSWQAVPGVFFLHLDELDLLPGKFEAEISRRSIRWRSAQRLDLPDVISSAELDSLGLPRQFESAPELDALSLSGGVSTGTVRIIRDPGEAGDLGDDCVLVCPSTDPSWTALFTVIKGLIVERGGVLSHGAITARDFGIPAVACPDATQIVKEGSRVRVDGDRGHVTIIEEEPRASDDQ